MRKTPQFESAGSNGGGGPKPRGLAVYRQGAVTLNLRRASWCVSPAIDSPLSSRISSPVGRGRNHSRDVYGPWGRAEPWGSLPRPGLSPRRQAGPSSLRPLQGPRLAHRPGLTPSGLPAGFARLPPASLTLPPGVPTAHFLMQHRLPFSGCCLPSGPFSHLVHLPRSVLRSCRLNFPCVLTAPVSTTNHHSSAPWVGGDQ